MLLHADALPPLVAKPGRTQPTDLLSPIDVERDYTIPENTQAVWRCTNRYGFRNLVIKLGRGVRYRRADLERWLESRRLGPQGDA